MAQRAARDGLDFRQLAPRCGGVRESFEELCCQLARRVTPDDNDFVRLQGAGGDGGIECYADDADGGGGRTGWQAKYVFDADRLITQLDESLSTALEIHPDLTAFIACFPFDLTGPTKRRGRSGVEKFDEWQSAREERARKEGRQLHIERWPHSKLLELILDHDRSGGLRTFFFDETVLTDDWFARHIASALKTAGPRYSPELTVETDLWMCVEALVESPTWCDRKEEEIAAFRQSLRSFEMLASRSSTEKTSPAWPEGLQSEARSILDHLEGIAETCLAVGPGRQGASPEKARNDVRASLSRVRELETDLATAFDEEHGPGRSQSVGFRQFMAEYQVSFPAANLDAARDVVSALEKLEGWLLSPAFSLGCEHSLILTGEAGSGKTHGVCDIAAKRLLDGQLSCMAFGHTFQGGPDPWIRTLEDLGLPRELGADGLLDLLQAAAEASGAPLLLVLDALNETRPLSYWRERLRDYENRIRQRRLLRALFTCRSSYLEIVIPPEIGTATVEHRGFAGRQRIALKAFFDYYGLNPPIAPMLPTEYANPLYLKLVCQTLQTRGMTQLPVGWSGLGSTIHAFLNEKEDRLAEPPRGYRRLHSLRGWSHGKAEPVLAGSS